MQRKIKIVLLMAGCLALLLIALVFAFWSGKVEHTNVLKADVMKAGIEETFKQGTAPSGTVQKEVSFRNDSSCAAFLRVSCAETWEKTEGESKVLLNNQLNGKDVADKNWANGFGQNSDLWQDGGDGWFYYRKVLKPGSQTEKILESITFPEYTGDYQAYKGADYQLYFRMELLQNSDSQSTLNRNEVNQKATKTVFGKEASVNGENVSWK